LPAFIACLCCHFFRVSLQLSVLTRLSLQDCGCSSFAGLLCHLPNLVALALPFNSTTSLEGLAQSATGNKLAVLDVSHNSIRTWAGSWLQGCTALTALDASCNKIAQPADLQALSR
jgi:Leucine-rich repeat (LRR) protein